MGTLSIGHILLVLVVVILVFGAGRLPRLMGDLAKGMKAFREGMKEGQTPARKEKKVTGLTLPSSAPIAPASKKTPTKKSPLKKASAKKTVAKKTAVKKPAVKKASPKKA